MTDVKQDPAPGEDAKEDKNAKLKEAAAAKAQGMVDYMFGKKKEKEKDGAELPIG